MPQPQQHQIQAASYNLHCHLQQCQILNLLSEASDQTLMDTSQVLNPLSHNGNSFQSVFHKFKKRGEST